MLPALSLVSVIKNFCRHTPKNVNVLLKSLQRGNILEILGKGDYCVKSVRIQSYSGPHFLVFGVNTPYLSVFSTNAGKY